MVVLIIGLAAIAVIMVVLWRFKFKARFLPNIAMAIIIIGIGSLCQPWIRVLYRYGLAVLMTGIASYIVTSHFE